MTTKNERKIQAGYEPIAGYRLEELIGQGGFGEVWRADAPGGIKKAVKFVFGATEQHRATRELRSLERIKAVHHPFLLALERFEIVDDQLVIVTELADGSLEDAFKRHRDRGSCGIPRAALLAYLHDAADALDYLHENYQLQHLDIKPGNLLLVGGHVKVADFGLLKDLRDDDCSVIGGLTPTYAPPEVFDGKPSLHSDQYSLAVMYQELLTGTRPFSGRTIAQLATQHVNSSPDLEPLPASDRPIIARALEKNPDRRFSSCKRFVETLRESRVRAAVSTFGEGLTSEDTDPGPGPFDPHRPAPVEDLPQLRADAARAPSGATSFALVIGLGGTGAECLQLLRARATRLGNANPLDLHSVLIDTDEQTIFSAGVAASDNTPRCHVLHAPLRSPMDYRRDGADRLSSMSRRWIYNVPRSKTTEGMRPLGRLALVDHAQPLMSTLRQAIAELAAACGDHTPHVYLVGSISGGTASGMFLDVVHLVRWLLDEAELHHASVLPLLAMQSLRNEPHRPLGVHDSCAALLEMRHYLQPCNGYPGDRAAKWPELPAARTPLRDAYLIATAPQPLQEHAAATISDYLWADANGAAELLAAARRTDGDPQSSQCHAASLRSVGVMRLGGGRALEETLLASATVRRLLLAWLGRPNEAKAVAQPLVDRLQRRCGLTRSARQQSQIECAGANDLEREGRLRDQLHATTAATSPDPDATDASLIAAIEAGTDSEGVNVWVNTTLDAIQRELSVRLHDRRLDVTAAIETVRLLAERVADEGRPTTCEAAHTTGTAHAADHRQPLIHRSEALLARVAEARATAQLTALGKVLPQLESRLHDLATVLARSIQHLQHQGSPATGNPWSQMPAEVNAEFAPLFHELHQHTAPGWLIRFILQRSYDIDPVELVSTVSDAALQRIQPILARCNQSTCGEPAASGSFAETMEASLVAARPPLLACGGRQRLLLIVGSEPERAKLEAQVRAAHPGALTVAVVPGMNPLLVHEAQQIKLDDVIARLATLAAGSPLVTERLHARSDITWHRPH